MLGWSLQKHWHYTDNPIYEGGAEERPAEPINATWAIGECLRILRYAKPYSGFRDVSYAPGNSFHLRLLVHYIGDIHQPLHCAQRITPESPNGDRGGNDFKLEKQKYGINNLHKLWDSGVFKYGTRLPLPLSDNHWDKLQGWSDDLRERYPPSSIEELDADYTQWSFEGHEISKNYVYPDIEEGGVASDEYTERGQEISDKQVVKGGYRLAKVLIDIWENENEEPMPNEEDSHEWIEFENELMDSLSMMMMQN